MKHCYTSAALNNHHLKNLPVDQQTFVTLNKKDLQQSGGLHIDITRTYECLISDRVLPQFHRVVNGSCQLIRRSPSEQAE